MCITSIITHTHKTLIISQVNDSELNKLIFCLNNFLLRVKIREKERELSLKPKELGKKSK